VEKIGRANEIWVSDLMALAHWRQGHHLAARQLADHSLQQMIQSPPNTAYMFEGHASAAEIYLGHWQAAASRSAADETTIRSSIQQACRVLSTFARAFPVGRPRAWLWQALAA
jgi:hypothetical protein